MIQPFTSSFIMPTKRFRRLSVLLAIHNNPNVSQHQMAEMSHLSSSMVNNYIKELKKEGLLRVSGKTNRTQTYYLEPSGEQELISLLVRYSTEIIQLYGAAKRELTNRLREIATDGITDIALFGAAETAEVVNAALKETSLRVKAVLDNDPNKQGRTFNGLTVQPPSFLKEADVDAVVITSFGKQDEIYNAIKGLVGKDVAIHKLSEL